MLSVCAVGHYSVPSSRLQSSHRYGMHNTCNGCCQLASASRDEMPWHSRHRALPAQPHSTVSIPLVAQKQLPLPQQAVPKRWQGPHLQVCLLDHMLWEAAHKGQPLKHDLVVKHAAQGRQQQQQGGGGQ